MAGFGITLFLCGTCKGRVNETTGFWYKDGKAIPKRTHCTCCHGNPFRGCNDRQNLRSDGDVLRMNVERALESMEFRTALMRNPSLKGTELGELGEETVPGLRFERGVDFWAFGKTIHQLQREITNLVEFEAQTGAPPSQRVVQFASFWDAERRRLKGRQDSKPRRG